MIIDVLLGKTDSGVVDGVFIAHLNQWNPNLLTKLTDLISEPKTRGTQELEIIGPSSNKNGTTVGNHKNGLRGNAFTF